MPRKPREGQPAAEALDRNPLIEERREDAAEDLTEALLNLDEKLSRGESPSEIEVGNVTMRKLLQLLAAPGLPEAAQLKCLELFTSLRAKKMVQKTKPDDPVHKEPDLRLPS